MCPLNSSPKQTSALTAARNSESSRLCEKVCVCMQCNVWASGRHLLWGWSCQKSLLSGLGLQWSIPPSALPPHSSTPSLSVSDALWFKNVARCLSEIEREGRRRPRWALLAGRLSQTQRAHSRTRSQTHLNIKKKTWWVAHSSSGLRHVCANYLLAQ